MSLQHRELCDRGWMLARGWPWQWPLVDFVEDCYHRFGQLVIGELEALQSQWMDGSACGSSRPGANVAEQVSKPGGKLAQLGIQVYASPPSELQVSPYEYSGPRFYVSLTKRALDVLGEAPPLPRGFAALLWPHKDDFKGQHRARSLGWTLAPPNSGPQSLHAELWGEPGHLRKGDRTRFPQLLWNHNVDEACATELVPGAFTRGSCAARQFERLKSPEAPALVFDSEILHRGAAVSGNQWVATLSIGLCSPGGWEAWKAGTGGTYAEDVNAEEWRMLPIRSQSADL